MSKPQTLNLPEILAVHAQWLADPATGQPAYLRGAYLSCATLCGANLSKANLSEANLSGADLRGADLRGANLSEANLRGANLCGAKLSEANLSGANLSEANLGWADLSEANLNGANLNGADLSRVNLSGANLSWATLSKAVLWRADLSGADLSEAIGLTIAADAHHRLRLAAVAALQEGALEMLTWHTCETTHCLGGWLIHQAGELGRLLEAAVGPEMAGLMLGGTEAHSHFYDDNETAATWMRSVLERSEVETAAA